MFFQKPLRELRNIFIFVLQKQDMSNTTTDSCDKLYSPDEVYYVQFFDLPVPEGQPQRKTFAVFQQHPEKKEPLYRLPESYYMEEGKDQLLWGKKRDFITFSVCGFKEVFIYDVFYRHTFQTTPPPDLTNYYWDEVHNAWVFSTKTSLSDFKLSYAGFPSCMKLPWRDKTIYLLQHGVKKQKTVYEPCLYHIAFFSSGSDRLLASCQDFLVKSIDDIEIRENGQTRIQAYNLERTEHLTVEFDLSTLGDGRSFKITIDNHDCQLHVDTIPVGASPFFNIENDYKGYGESGVIEEYTKFVNKLTGENYLGTDDLIEGLPTWNHDGTKVFFNSYDSSQLAFFDNCISRFSIWDVAGKKLLNRYMGHAIHPRWNEDETDAVFDNRLITERELWRREHEEREEQEKQAQETAGAAPQEAQKTSQEAPREAPQEKKRCPGKPFIVLPSPDGVHALYLKRREPKNGSQSCIYDISIIDQRMAMVIVENLPYPVTGSDAIRQLGNGMVTYHEANYNIITFDFNDLVGATQLKLKVRTVPKKPERYVWTSSGNPDKSHWDAILDGQPFSPRPFYYDHLPYESHQNIPILITRKRAKRIYNNENYDNSSKYIIKQQESELQFIVSSSDKVHFSIPFRIDHRSVDSDPLLNPAYAIWNKQGTRFFFTGYALTPLELPGAVKPLDPQEQILVAVDVKNKEIMEIDKFKPSDPHWNQEGTSVCFTNPPERIFMLLPNYEFKKAGPQAEEAHGNEPHGDEPRTWLSRIKSFFENLTN